MFCSTHGSSEELPPAAHGHTDTDAWSESTHRECVPLEQSAASRLSSSNPSAQLREPWRGDGHQENRALSVNMHSPCELAEAEAPCIGPAWVCTSSCSMYDLGSQPVGYNPCGESNGLVTGFHITYLH